MNVVTKPMDRQMILDVCSRNNLEKLDQTSFSTDPLGLLQLPSFKKGNYMDLESLNQKLKSPSKQIFIGDLQQSMFKVKTNSFRKDLQLNYSQIHSSSKMNSPNLYSPKNASQKKSLNGHPTSKSLESCQSKLQEMKFK